MIRRTFLEYSLPHNSRKNTYEKEKILMLIKILFCICVYYLRKKVKDKAKKKKYIYIYKTCRELGGHFQNIVVLQTTILYPCFGLPCLPLPGLNVRVTVWVLWKADSEMQLACRILLGFKTYGRKDWEEGNSLWFSPSKVVSQPPQGFL